ncbi:SatD family protein [Belliella kenyensis]|uniref:SatD family protein n=1 Tax=Belliella kenyensis TaxID=1472724 RepID=A0ABV8EKL5_9BACT|nr:SatD family protein [Belliella kenyensis]MCH7400448.1 SatD family protein [Belliella kenyensis]MDN3604536.1 SatD family protein [Belliella kenyensis]
MIAILRADIVSSRTLDNQDKWIRPLKQLLATWGKSPKTWKVDWGDSIQIEISDPEEALLKALQIKALIKRVSSGEGSKLQSSIDIRIAIGIGEKTYSAKSISESNGPAFIYSAEKFENLKKENVNLGIKTPWEEFDEEMNLYLKLAGLFMDRWTFSSAELVESVLMGPQKTQEEIGKLIGIKQNTVSGRWSRANVDELKAVEKIFRKKINNLLQ